jgi:lipoprotein-anchoring transpeptidase ErfK/SrfK
MIRLFAATLLLSLTAVNAAQSTSRAKAELSSAAVNSAAPGERNEKVSLIVKVEVLLDRAHYSPGQIDGKDGENFRKALRAFQQANNLTSTGKVGADTWTALTANVSELVLKPYTITEADVAGPFDKRIPRGLEQASKLQGLSYKDSVEALSEKFHMSEQLLRALNPGVDFDRAGQTIAVANVEPLRLRRGNDSVEVERPRQHEGAGGSAATVVVDKPAQEVRAYDKEGKLLAFYPATIGSQQKPAPSGVFKVRRVAWNPDYHYDPKFAWKGVKANRKLTLPPGPNNPVGLAWIDLTAPSYGIHGTPEPQNISKTESHGCIRLTNWDAVDLATMVHPGTVVKFDDQDTPVLPLAAR